MNLDRVNLTKAQYLKLRRLCRIDSRGPRRGFSIQYDIPGHASPFRITNWAHQTFVGKTHPYDVVYNVEDAVTAMLIRNITKVQS